MIHSRLNVLNVLKKKNPCFFKNAEALKDVEVRTTHTPDKTRTNGKGTGCEWTEAEECLRRETFKIYLN